MIWDDKKKVEVVVTWLALGKVPLVESVTGVPKATIKQWKLQPWWGELVNEIQSDSDQELDTKLTKIVDKSLDAVVDRIDNGELILDSKTGTIKRIPVKLKDVHKVSIDLIDKRNLIRGKPTSRTEQIQSVDILQKLATQFALWVQTNRPKEKVIEGEVLAIHEGRAQGLQEGVQPLPQSPETNTQQG